MDYTYVWSVRFRNQEICVVEAQDSWYAKKEGARVLKDRLKLSKSLSGIAGALGCREVKPSSYADSQVEEPEYGICPGCGMYARLVTHHWMLPRKDFHARICSGCNVALGYKYRGNYPSWEEQLAYLRSKYPKMEELVFQVG